VGSRIAWTGGRSCGGYRTALADDPLLTARPAGMRQALRVVVDSCLRLPPQSQLSQTARTQPLLICAGPNANADNAAALESLGCKLWISPIEDRQQRLGEMLEMLAQQTSVTNILVEGGGELLGGLYDIHQIDQCEIFVAPKVIGGKSSPSPLAGLGIEKVSDSPEIDLVKHQMREQDMHLSYRLRWK
jgi:diaminohydroxyphosphoribosylaminopyrimidine deaminase/5-amino-6-(5-phosphoribosylamino)uracil reductase